MQDLNFELKQLCQRNRDGSFATQVARERALALTATQLIALGYKNMTIHSLKPKHITALVERWQNEKLSVGTVKNRMAHLRWWTEKIDKRSIIARDNETYGIADRRYVTNVSKAVHLSAEQLALVTDENTSLSLQLQAAFGLRREESIKFAPVHADQGDRLVLKASWCKGGREREIPILSSMQRALLERVHDHCGQASLIPAAMSFKDQLERFKYQCGLAGINRVHGHRHGYAQRRYLELTGWACPAVGGLISSAMTKEQKVIDQAARRQISQELGHEREQITAVYLGR